MLSPHVDLREGGCYMHRNIFASPDGVTSDGVLVEVKCPFAREPILNEIPMNYYMQVQAQLEAAQASEADFVDFSPEFGTVLVSRIYHNPHFCRLMQDRAAGARYLIEVARNDPSFDTSRLGNHGFVAHTTSLGTIYEGPSPKNFHKTFK